MILLIGLVLLALVALILAGLVAAIGPDSPRRGITIDTRAPVILANRVPPMPGETSPTEERE